MRRTTAGIILMRIPMCFFAICIIGIYAPGAIAARYDDPNVQLAQSLKDGHYFDGRTGQFVSGIKDMPADYFDQAAAAAVGAAAPNTPAGSQAAAPAAAADAAAPANQRAGRVGGIRTNWGNMSGMARAGAALGIVGGAAGIYGSVAGDDEHGAGDVALGASSGAALGATVGSIVPGIGTGVGAVGGAVIGGIFSGSQLFSETDCLHDPVTGLFTCCHTQFNQGERYADIGDYMFCGVESDDGSVRAIIPGVRQCLQGGNDTAASWWDGLWLDDFWSPECVVRICDNTVPPAEYTGYIDYTENVNDICWDWNCTNGYRRSGNTCVPVDVNNAPPLDPYNTLIQRLQNERNKIIQTCGPGIEQNTSL